MQNLVVEGVHGLTVTEAMESKAKQSFNKVLSKFEMYVESSKLTLSVNGHLSKATAKLHLKGKEVTVTEEGKDMYKVITSVAQKTLRQVRQHKEIVTSKQSSHEELYEGEVTEHESITLPI